MITFLIEWLAETFAHPLSCDEESVTLACVGPDYHQSKWALAA